MRQAIIKSTVCFIIALFIFTLNVAFAQSAEENNAFLPEGDDPLNAPIDGGVSLLIAAGVAYGAKKAHEHRKNKKQQIEK